MKLEIRRAGPAESFQLAEVVIDGRVTGILQLTQTEFQRLAALVRLQREVLPRIVESGRLIEIACDLGR